MLLFNCPLSPEKADRLIATLALSPGSRFVDVGCGTGEFLIRTIERYQAVGVGIDPNPIALEECGRKTADRIASEIIELHPIPADQFPWPAHTFDAGICIGSTHAFGGYLPTLKHFKQFLPPGGTIIVGDLFWHQPPAEPYQTFLGDGWPPAETDFTTLAQAGEREGLTLLYATASNPDEWDHFESSYARKRYEAAWLLEAGPEQTAAVEQTRKWYNAYLKWGRGTMGFGFYVYRNG